MEEQNKPLQMLENCHEMLAGAIKLAANEPSMGLYFVQQHVQRVVPVLVDVKSQMLTTTAKVELATANTKDSLVCIKVMKECGLSVVGRMIERVKGVTCLISRTNSQQSRGRLSQLLPSRHNIRLPSGPWISNLLITKSNVRHGDGSSIQDMQDS